MYDNTFHFMKKKSPMNVVFKFTYIFTLCESSFCLMLCVNMIKVPILHIYILTLKDINMFY